MKTRIGILIVATLAVMLLAACEPESYDTYCSISGTVIESGTNEPIQGVTITITPEKQNTTTGHDGTFYFSNLDATIPSVRIQAQKIGYETNILSINTIAGETINITIPLSQCQ